MVVAFNQSVITLKNHETSSFFRVSIPFAGPGCIFGLIVFC